MNNWNYQTANPEAAGAAMIENPHREEIPTRIGKAIFATLICFWPAALVGLVYACRVRGAITRGDLPLARDLSDKANMWCNVSIGVAVVLLALLFFTAALDPYSY